MAFHVDGSLTEEKVCLHVTAGAYPSSETKGRIAEGKSKRAKENGDEEKRCRARRARSSRPATLFFVAIFFCPF